MINPAITSVVMFSSGISSWAAGKRYADQNGTDGMVLLFADTFIEDDDNYRFLVESAANIYGLPVPSCAYWELPSQELDMINRKKALREMAEAAMLAIPGLVWIAEGRDPWEVMRDVKMIGNSRIDPCSRVLKREFLAKWRDANCDPATTKIIFGIGWDEEHRIDRVRIRAAPWICLAPLCDSPPLSKHQLMDWARREGVEPAAMYATGSSHANCGLFCIKGGQQAFKLLHAWKPARYHHHEEKEQEMIALVGDHSILKHRSGPLKGKPLTLKEFREKIEREEQIDIYDFGGCGCALTD